MKALARSSDPQTSFDAAETVKVSGLQADCLRAIRNAPLGLTSEELAAVTGHSLVTVSPRLHGMMEMGLIYRAGKRKNRSGCMAIVWMAVPKPMQQLSILD